MHHTTPTIPYARKDGDQVHSKLCNILEVAKNAIALPIWLPEKMIDTTRLRSRIGTHVAIRTPQAGNTLD